MEPGRRWTYCGGATALLARIIAKGTGKPLHAYAREALFDPLGIGPTDWLAGADGEPFAASGLRMTPRDLACIGVMMAAGGVWRGGTAGDGAKGDSMAGARRVLPADWIERATAQFVNVDELRRFGYHWYVGDFAFGGALGWVPARLERYWGEFGEGGQRLFVLPGLDLAVAITAGNYGADDQWIPPIRVMREVVLPGVL